MNEEIFTQLHEWLLSDIPYDFSFRTAYCFMQLPWVEPISNHYVYLEGQTIYVKDAKKDAVIFRLDLAGWDQSALIEGKNARFLFGKGEDTFIEFYFYGR